MLYLDVRIELSAKPGLAALWPRRTRRCWPSLGPAAASNGAQASCRAGRAVGRAGALVSVAGRGRHLATGQAPGAALQAAGEAITSSRALTSFRDPKNDCLDSVAERRAPSGALIFGACWLCHRPRQGVLLFGIAPRCLRTYLTH
jgi:hypothetical protein